MVLGQFLAQRAASPGDWMVEPSRKAFGTSQNRRDVPDMCGVALSLTKLGEDLCPHPLVARLIARVPPEDFAPIRKYSCTICVTESKWLVALVSVFARLFTLFILPQ